MFSNSKGSIGFFAFLLFASSSFAQPANNHFANAIEITTPYVTGSNVGANRQNGEPQSVKHGTSRSPLGGKSVWWKWTAPETRRYTVKTGDRSGREPSSNFDTQIGVYTGTALSNLKEVASNDDHPDYADGLSSLEIEAVQGKTYYIIVDGYQGKTGTIHLYVIPPRYSLTVDVYPPDSGHVSFDPIFESGGYEAGTFVTLEATPTTDAPFYAWSGSDGGRSSRITVRMDRHKKLIAHFATPPPVAERDPQVLWRNKVNGKISAWNFSGGRFSSATPLPNLVLPWQPRAVADIDGNGYSDLLFQHPDWRISAALLEEDRRKANFALGRMNGWRLVGSGDFNFDARPDLLLQNTSGALRVSYLENGLIKRSVSAGTSGPSWNIRAVADLNNDASADIIFQHQDGRVRALLMNGVARRSSVMLGTTKWRLAGATDVNNDENVDLVFDHANGRSAVWIMQGTNLLGRPFLRDGRVMPAAWKILGGR